MIIKGSIHSKEDVFLNGEMEGDLDVENCQAGQSGPMEKLPRTHARGKLISAE